MILSSHLCLLTDGSWGRFPVVRVDSRGVVESLELCPDGPEEIGGMIFRCGVMVCGLPADFVGLASSGRDFFAEHVGRFAVAPGRGPVAILEGGDLSSLVGLFSRWNPPFNTHI